MLSANQFVRFLNQLFVQNQSKKQPHFLHVDTNSQKLKVDWKCFGLPWSKMDVFEYAQKWDSKIDYLRNKQME